MCLNLRMIILLFHFRLIEILNDKILFLLLIIIIAVYKYDSKYSNYIFLMQLSLLDYNYVNQLYLEHMNRLFQKQSLSSQIKNKNTSITDISMKEMYLPRQWQSIYPIAQFINLSLLLIHQKKRKLKI